MSTGPRIRLIVASALVLLAAAPLEAQYCRSLSIDSFVRSGDQVLIGRVLSVVTVPGGLANQPAGTVTLAVEETLRGSPVQGPLSLPFANFDYLAPGPFYPDRSGPRIQSHRLLVALRHGTQASARIAAIDLDAPSLSIMNPDLTEIRTAAGVIRAARKALRRIPADGKPPDGFEWPAPGYSRKGDPFYDCQIVVPVDERLEKRAQAILEGESGGPRYIAVLALRHFKSEENISLLTGLLSDSNEGVRRNAQQVLWEWGIDADAPRHHP